MNRELADFLKNFSEFLSSEIHPIADQLDDNHQLLKQSYDRLCALGALRLTIPRELGGLGGDRKDWIHYNIDFAQHSGALLFLQAQHQLAVSQLKNLLPDTTIEQTLSSLATSNQGVGVALAAHRNIIKVNTTKEGYHVSGKLFWVTGYQALPLLLFSFDDGKNMYFTLIPFHETTDAIRLSPPIAIAAFYSTHTVSIELNNYFIEKNSILAERPLAPRSRFQHPAIYNFAGASKALLSIAEKGKYASNPQAKNQHAQLLTEWKSYYTQIINDQMCPLKLRAIGLDLAERSALFARVVCGSESLLASHPINRLMREIWQYSIAGYSEDQLESYLSHIFP